MVIWVENYSSQVIMTCFELVTYFLQDDLKDWLGIVQIINVIVIFMTTYVNYSLIHYLID